MSDEALTFLHRFPALTVVVIGDAILDCYYSGRSERVCREAPVPVVLVDSTERTPGGGANSAANVAALGARVMFVGVIGDDEGGERLTSTLRAAGVDTGGLIVAEERATIVKRRLLCDGAMVARFDEGTTEDLASESRERLAQTAARAVAESDVVILSDYCLGAFSPELLSAVEASRRPETLLAVDSSRLAFFRALAPDVVKPSLPEALAQLGVVPAAHPDADRIALARTLECALLELTGARNIALTLDGDGAWLFRPERDAVRLPAKRIDDPHATGAGDTFLSSFALSLASGAPAEEAGRIANIAARIVTTQPHTSMCTLDDLTLHFSAHRKHVSGLAELSKLGERYRHEGRRIVLTNGCFDILHPGHVGLLEQAKDLGDVLVVAVNSDASIRALKGDGRPINPLESRLSVIAGLSSVDHTFAFDDPTAAEVVAALRPAVYAKGGDYRAEDLPEYAAVAECGGRLEILPLFGEESTTRVIRRVMETAVGPVQ